MTPDSYKNNDIENHNERGENKLRVFTTLFIYYFPLIYVLGWTIYHQHILYYPYHTQRGDWEWFFPSLVYAFSISLFTIGLLNRKDKSGKLFITVATITLALQMLWGFNVIIGSGYGGGVYVHPYQAAIVPVLASFIVAFITRAYINSRQTKKIRLPMLVAGLILLWSIFILVVPLTL